MIAMNNIPQLMNAYARADVTFVRGRGARLWDDQGREYLDALAGIAVCILGHAHPAVSKTVCEQVETLTHTSNIFHIKAQQELAIKLCELSGMDNVFFSNSGGEANEAAIKIARKYGNDKGVNLPTIIVTEGSFHGRTLATLSATGNEKIRKGFAPYVEGFVRVPFNDIEAIKKVAAENNNIVAILVEPIQGEGGINVPDDNYLPQIRELCDQHQWLMMLDEIQSGMGRTGKFFAYQHFNLYPDVVTVAKGLGNGFPIGACLAKNKAAAVIQPGNHGSTFGGNPLACSAANTVLNTLLGENLMARAQQLGQRMLQGFREQLTNPLVKEVRGKGLMIGIELNKPCTELMNAALAAGVVINITVGNVVRLLPSLIITDQEADAIVSKVATVINNFQ
jgi:acetylornithine aminotransferase